MPDIENNIRWNWAGVLLCLSIALILALRKCGDSPQEPQNRSEAISKRDRPDRRSGSPRPIHQTSTGGMESDWQDPQSKTVFKVRKILQMEATPSVTEGASEATATISIRVHESGEILKPDRGEWEEMTPVEFADWRGGCKDIHSVTATMVKTIDSQSGEIKIERQETIGDGSTEPHSYYNETQSGINISIGWEGDVLVLSWSAVQSEKKTAKIEIPFSKRFQHQKPSEQDARGTRR